ncbi:ABC transporter permease [Parasphingorhabdus marina]|uniref:ABC transporter permease n=1 Tax=Parasphingorhabdus marina TaxID=394732 RepID=UPI000A044A67|nr:ABC transporter permease [Parasphingorhabdus marina]
MSLPQWMGALDRKLLRDIWRLRSQALAIALVIAAGIGMVVMSFGMMRSLEATRDAYYDRYRFADIFASAKRFPESLIGDVRAIDGVSIVEGRLTTAATLDVPGMAEPVTAIIHSLPATGMPRVNALVLRSGRMPDPRQPDEVLASEKFADAARIAPGDMIEALVYGKKQNLRVVGTVLSPEYVYAIGPGQIFPDNRRFGILWMGEEHLAAALNSTNAYNEALIRLERGAAEQDVIDRVDVLLERYGGRGAIPRRDQISDRFLANEMVQLNSMTAILPPIFLGVAAFLINMVLSRLVESEREIIGLLTAFGYRSRTIMAHYAKLALVLSLPGLVMGMMLGNWMGRGLAGMFQKYYVFPFLNYRAGFDVYFVSCLVAILVVLIGAAQTVRKIGKLTAAEAMRPPVPPNYSGGFARLIGKIKRLDEPTRIILRGLVRRPVRTLLGAFGVAAALGLYVTSAGSMDNVDLMTDMLFNQANRADVNVTFAEPRDERVLFELARLPGVMRVEPVRSVSATFRAGHRSRTESLTGIEPAGDLNRLIDMDDGLTQPPVRGLMLSSILSGQLGVEIGDKVQVEITDGRRPHLTMPVADILKSPVANPAIVKFDQLGPIMRETPLASGAYLSIDPNHAETIYRQLKDMPIIAGFSRRAAALTGIEETIGETMGVVSLFNTGFAALIVFGVVYNNARISLAERARDLVSLRVLGYRRPEVSYILLGELALIVIAGLPLGIVFGYYLSRYLTASMSGDLFILPFALSAETVAVAVLVVLVTAAISALFVRSRLDRLDLVTVLKTRE